MNAFQMEDWGRANKPAQTPLDHSTAAVSLDTLYMGMLVSVAFYVFIVESWMYLNHHSMHSMRLYSEVMCTNSFPKQQASLSCTNYSVRAFGKFLIFYFRL